MDAFRLLRAGAQTTPQDLGRPGYAKYGVPIGGAADALSLRLGNLLLDNPESAAGLEITLAGPRLLALSETICAAVGAPFSVRLNGVHIPMNRMFRVRTDDILDFGAATLGARAYLCIAGGFQTHIVLGSQSCDLSTGIGGRVLRRGDTLEANGHQSYVPADKQLKRRFLVPCKQDYGIRVVMGPQARTGGLLRYLLFSEWAVSADANRIGVRLDGNKQPTGITAFDSEGIPSGSIQVTPDGTPIVLGVEHQTTGGYPKPAVVAAVDLPLIGQLRPGNTVRFELISVEHSIELLRMREESIRTGVYVEDTTARALESLRNSALEELEITVGDKFFRWRRGSSR